MGENDIKDESAWKKRTIEKMDVRLDKLFKLLGNIEDTAEEWERSDGEPTTLKVWDLSCHTWT